VRLWTGLDPTVAAMREAAVTAMRADKKP
jgi:hypothetical protein